MTRTFVQFLGQAIWEALHLLQRSRLFDTTTVSSIWAHILGSPQKTPQSSCIGTKLIHDIEIRGFAIFSEFDHLQTIHLQRIKTHISEISGLLSA